MSIETFFKKCYIQKTFTNIDFEDFDLKKYHYICRYRLIPLSKRKFKLEPVLEQERNALSLLATPKRNIIQRTPKVATPKTPNSISKKMGDMSITDQSNWSVSKADGTKMLLKRAIFSEKNEKSSPNTVKLKFSSPSRSKNLQEHEVAEILSMELEENSDDELPTLIIKQSLPTTPKKAPAIKNLTPSNVKSGKKIKIDDNLAVELKENSKGELPTLIIREHKRTPVKQKPLNNENLRKSTRTPVKSVKYYEDEMSPIDVTPKKSIKKRMFSDRSDDDFIATPKSKQTSRNTSQAVTPKRSVAKRILTNTLTPTLHKRTHSIDKTNGKFECFVHFKGLTQPKTGHLYLLKLSKTGQLKRFLRNLVQSHSGFEFIFHLTPSTLLLLSISHNSIQTTHPNFMKKSIFPGE